MLRSLSVKLTVSFVVITLLATLAGGIIVRNRTIESFVSFVEENNRRLTEFPPFRPENREQFEEFNRSQEGAPPLGRNGRRFQPGTPEGIFENNVYESLIWGFVSGTAVALLIGIGLSRQLIKPISSLTLASHQLAKGELGVQVPVTTTDEIGDLTQAFNKMSVDLARANRLREQMTADIAHDLRTPLSVIAGYTEALNEGKLQGNPDMYEAMNTQVHHLQHLLDDLRTISLADAGELRLHPRAVNPKALLERAAITHFQQAEEQSIQLELNASSDLPAVTVDVERIAQVLNNLVSNALRHTPAQGKISLNAGPDKNGVLFEVSDSGEGIASEDLPNVFERFYRGDDSRHRAKGQSGLGLAIAKSIIGAHKGKISVRSQVGQGTTFAVWLPTRE